MWKGAQHLRPDSLVTRSGRLHWGSIKILSNRLEAWGFSSGLWMRLPRCKILNKPLHLGTGCAGPDR